MHARAKDARSTRRILASDEIAGRGALCRLHVRFFPRILIRAAELAVSSPEIAQTRILRRDIS